MVPEKQKEFVRNFTGQTLGRYHILYLTIINIVGGEEIRKEVQAKYGREQYLPDQMYPTREELEMVIHAVDRGVSAERLGRMVPQSYKRSHPEIMKVVTRDNALDILVAAWDDENQYATKTIEIVERGPNRAVLARKINPMPCGFFKGVVLGMFEVIDVPATCRELKCQWTDPGETACLYEVTWK